MPKNSTWFHVQVMRQSSWSQIFVACDAQCVSGQPLQQCVVHSYIMQFVHLLQATPADRPHGIIVRRMHWKHSNTFNALSLCASQITQNSMWRLGAYLPQKCEKEPNSLTKGHTTRMTRVSVRHIACSWIPCLRKVKIDDSSHVISQFHVTPVLTPFI